MGGKNARKIFFRNTRISRIINDGKKRLEKVRKHVFFYKHTNIVTKKWGEKREEKFVKKHTNRVSKNCWKKIVWKKCENTFLINT